jgi:hypothetical protein
MQTCTTHARGGQLRVATGKLRTRAGVCRQRSASAGAYSAWLWQRDHDPPCARTHTWRRTISAREGAHCTVVLPHAGAQRVRDAPRYVPCTAQPYWLSAGAPQWRRVHLRMQGRVRESARARKARCTRSNKEQHAQQAGNTPHSQRAAASARTPLPPHAAFCRCACVSALCAGDDRTACQWRIMRAASGTRTQVRGCSSAAPNSARTRALQQRVHPSYTPAETLRTCQETRCGERVRALSSVKPHSRCAPYRTTRLRKDRPGAPAERAPQPPIRTVVCARDVLSRNAPRQTRPPVSSVLSHGRAPRRTSAADHYGRAPRRAAQRKCT